MYLVLMLNLVMRYFIFSAFCALMSVLFFSCNSTEIGRAEDVNPETIYFDYQISGEEKNSEATVLLQYRFGGVNGTTLTIGKPGKVEFDDHELKADSTRITGAYYEWQQPLNNFSGKHLIRFTNPNGKQYNETFDFSTFSVPTEIASIKNSDSLIIQLSGTKEGELLNVNLADTVFRSNGVDKNLPVYDNKIVVANEDLKNLAKGPITLKLSRELSKPIMNGTKEGGRITTVFSVRREFWIK